MMAPRLLEQGVAAGLRSLFVGFETLNPANLAEQRKIRNMRSDYRRDRRCTTWRDYHGSSYSDGFGEGSVFGAGQCDSRTGSDPTSLLTP